MLWPYQNIATYQFKSTADHYHLGNKRFAFVIKFCFLNFWQSSKKKHYVTSSLFITPEMTVQLERFALWDTEQHNVNLLNTYQIIKVIWQYSMSNTASCSEEQNTGSNPSQVWAVRPAECRNISNRFSSSTQGTRRVKQSNLKNIHSWDEDFLSVPL